MQLSIAVAFLLTATAQDLFLVPQPSASVAGYYRWTWQGLEGEKGDGVGYNMGIAFSGYTDVDTAISESSRVRLSGTKYLSIGGGNAVGIFNVASLTKIAASAAKVKGAGYEGVMFDVEEVYGSAADMVPAFAKAFAAFKSQGMRVGVTTSHSAPYYCYTPADAVTVVKAWVADPNVDILSPQLYTSGSERSPMFDETNFCKDSGCTWGLYVGGRAAFAPSIVTASQYSAVQSYFSARNITTAGYIQWAQR